MHHEVCLGEHRVLGAWLQEESVDAWLLGAFLQALEMPQQEHLQVEHALVAYDQVLGQVEHDFACDQEE